MIKNPIEIFKDLSFVGALGCAYQIPMYYIIYAVVFTLAFLVYPLKSVWDDIKD